MAGISVIIPNYNRASLIGDTIENMLAQSLAPSEVIVVDDGSTDNSRDVIRSFGSRVRLIAQENQGPGAARNAGFAASTGEFIQFMDSDDLASRNKLAMQLAALESSEADFAYCSWVRTEIGRGEMAFVGPVMQSQVLPDWKPMLEWQMGPWCLVFQNCLFRRSILEQAGQFRTDLISSEDSEYLVRILLAGANPVFTGRCIVFYRCHNQNQLTSSGMSNRRRAEDWSHYLEVVGENVAGHLGSFHYTTRLDIALNVYRHNRYCRKHGWQVLNATTPFSRLSIGMPRLRLVWADYYERLLRKARRIHGSTPNSPGLALRAVNENDLRLAQDLGFGIRGFCSSRLSNRK